MKSYYVLKHPSGKLKAVKIGFSWPILVGVILIIATTVYGNDKVNKEKFQSNFVKVRLPYSISIDIPRIFGILDEGGKNLLGTMSESLLDLSGFKDKHNIDIKFKNVLTARTMTEKTYASVNIVVVNDRSRTQQGIKNASEKDLHITGQAIRRSFETGETGIKIKIVEWKGYGKGMFKGYNCIKYGYIRIGQNSRHINVDVMEIPLGNRTVSLITSYQEDHKDLWEDIFKRIIYSFEVK